MFIPIIIAKSLTKNFVSCDNAAQMTIWIFAPIGKNIDK